MTVSASAAYSTRLRSPWHWLGSRLSSGNVAIGFSTAGFAGGEAVSRVEQGRSDADRHRQLVARDHRSQDAVVRRRRRRSGKGRHAARHKDPNPVGEGVEKIHHAGPGRSDDVERHEHAGVRWQRVDDVLVGTVEPARSGPTRPTASPRAGTPPPPAAAAAPARKKPAPADRWTRSMRAVGRVRSSGHPEARRDRSRAGRFRREFQEIGDGRHRLEVGSPSPRRGARAWVGGATGPASTFRRAAGYVSNERRQASAGRSRNVASEPRIPFFEQRRDHPQDHLGPLDVGLRRGQPGVAALVGLARQLELQGVLQDLVGPQREIVERNGLLGEGQPPVDGRTSSNWSAVAATVAAGWFCHRAYSSRRNPVQLGSSTPRGKPLGRPSISSLKSPKVS